MPDELRSLSVTIREQALRGGFRIYPARDLGCLWEKDGKPSGETLLEWDQEAMGWEGFLQSAKALGANLLYVQTRPFCWEDDLNNALDGLSGLSKSEVMMRKASARAFKQYDGLTERLTLAFKAHGAWHAYDQGTPWLWDYWELLEPGPETGRREPSEDISET